MENSSNVMSRRERRRRQNEEKCESEDNRDITIKQKKIAARDSKLFDNNSRILVRRETFTVLKQGPAFESYFSPEKVMRHDDGDDDDNNKEESSIGGNEFDPESDSDNSKNLTRTINVDTWKTDSRNLTYDVNSENYLSKHETYSIEKSESDRPVPAPRRLGTTSAKEPDKNSSDTDKDIMEIEVDEGNTSNGTVSSKQRSEAVTKATTFESDTSYEEPPKPKPRKLSSISCAFPRTDSISKSKSLEEITIKAVSPRSTKSEPETKACGYRRESAIEEEPKFVEENKTKKIRRLAALFNRKKEKKSSRFSSMMKLEKGRMPTISSILRDLKEDSTKTKLQQEDGIDFEMDSPRVPQSAPNDKMYVQYKNGFYLTNREDVLKRDEDFAAKQRERGRMEDSATSNMLKTGMAFQKYWSRSMMYVHGVLAGLGFGHAFAISAILLYSNKSEKFIDVYACLALKIHFIFYTLIALSLISCLDGLDVGHTTKKHWRNICSNFPSSWFIFLIYAASFLLTFANHNTEFRFDARHYGNGTGEKLPDAEFYDDATSAFSCWYRVAWARDVTVLAAWLLISLTEFPDNLYVYVQNLASQSESDDTKLGIVIS